MKIKIVALVIGFIWVMGVGGENQASAVPLPDPTTTIGATPVALPYGDFYSYSLPILAYYYDLMYGGGTGPGNPFYVTSTPGAIKNDIVIGTGASGGPVNTNFTGMDDAYDTNTVNPDVDKFSTGYYADPGGTGEFAGDVGDAWDAEIGALLTYLAVPGGARNDLIFFFNNNQENSGGAENQNLWAWGQARIVDVEGDLDTLYFDLTNNQSGPPVYVSPGAADSNAPYTPRTGTWPNDDFVIPDNDFILSGGQVCLDALGNIVACGSPEEVVRFDHNLGADQAAYAIYSPEINDNLEAWLAEGYDTVQLDIRFFALNNGYEQIFIQGGTVGGGEVPIPEPASMILMGSGLLGIAAIGRRRLRKRRS